VQAGALRRGTGETIRARLLFADLLALWRATLDEDEHYVYAIAL
jgi:hypothetical protein